MRPLGKVPKWGRDGDDPDPPDDWIAPCWRQNKRIGDVRTILVAMGISGRVSTMATALARMLLKGDEGGLAGHYPPGSS